MREITSAVEKWFSCDEGVAIAQVVKTWGSSPRRPGAMMAISSSGRIAGSVSGGCVEGAVVSSSEKCLTSNRSELLTFHASDAEAQGVGLSCGGSVDVLLTVWNQGLFELEAELAKLDAGYYRVTRLPVKGQAENTGQMFLLAEVASVEQAIRAKPEAQNRVTISQLGDDRFCVVLPHNHSVEGSVVNSIAAQLLSDFDGSAYQEAGMLNVKGKWFVAVVRPKAKIVCVGATHTSVFLCRFASIMGYKTTVVDPRRIFATDERFPFVDSLITEWPQEAFKHIAIDHQTAICALTHDPKIDIPALSIALKSDAFYIGSLGRPSTQVARYESLRELGYSDAQIGRISGPIGLDIGGKDPEDIALSVMAEISLVRRKPNATVKSMVDSAKRVAG